MAWLPQLLFAILIGDPGFVAVPHIRASRTTSDGAQYAMPCKVAARGANRAVAQAPAAWLRNLAVLLLLVRLRVALISRVDLPLVRHGLDLVALEGEGFARRALPGCRLAGTPAAWRLRGLRKSHAATKAEDGKSGEDCVRCHGFIPVKFRLLGLARISTPPARCRDAQKLS